MEPCFGISRGEAIISIDFENSLLVGHNMAKNGQIDQTTTPTASSKSNATAYSLLSQSVAIMNGSSNPQTFTIGCTHTRRPWINCVARSLRASCHGKGY
jgi:hypothetical protein